MAKNKRKEWHPATKPLKSMDSAALNIMLRPSPYHIVAVYNK
jgi:hypothetical protein